MNYCKLCEDNIADQKNSHIISKFLGIGMFGDTSDRKAFRNRRDSTPQKVQDLPKEDFVFCKTCEAKFSSIESIVSKALSKKTLEEFHSNYLKIGEHEVETKNLSCKEILLFFYITFFRLHHSELEGFQEFKLLENVLHRIRNVILNNLSIKLKETKERIEASNFDYIPITVMTTDFNVDQSQNLLTVNQTNNPKTNFFICNNWAAHLFCEEAIKYDERFIFKYHLNIENKRFMFLNKLEWRNMNMIFADEMVRRNYKF